jgi:predicted nuclease of predicted toxin-antitoxin system
MRFLANENFPGTAVSRLKSLGHDVIWVRTAAPGASDADVLAWAAREGRVLLTFDTGFGELARAASLPCGCGVVLFRIAMPRASEAGQRLADVLAGRHDWADHFSVVEPGRIRMRPL